MVFTQSTVSYTFHCALRVKTHQPTVNGPVTSELSRRLRKDPEYIPIPILLLVLLTQKNQLTRSAAALSGFQDEMRQNSSKLFQSKPSNSKIFKLLPTDLVVLPHKSGLTLQPPLYAGLLPTVVRLRHVSATSAGCPRHG